MNKKIFMELLQKDFATVKINDVFTLYHYITTNCIGEKVEFLQVICNNPIGAKQDYDYYIKARKFDEFLKEFSGIVADYFNKLAREEAKKARNNAFNFKKMVF